MKHHRNIKRQYVPPEWLTSLYHRTITAATFPKIYIQFWRDHFIAALSGAAATFPLHLWCQLIPKTEKIVIITTIKCQQKHIVVCPLTRQPWLFWPPFRAHRNGGTHSQETQPKENLGLARCKRVGDCNLWQALSFLAPVGSKDKSYKDIRHGIF